MLHNVKTHGNIEKYTETIENKKKGIEVDRTEKMISNYKKEIKSTEEKWIHKFGGKLTKKRGQGGEIDVCIKVKGEDGEINEILIKGEPVKKKKGKGKKAKGKKKL